MSLCTVYSVQCALYSVQYYTVCTVQCALYNLHCTVCTVRWLCFLYIYLKFHQVSCFSTAPEYILIQELRKFVKLEQSGGVC